MFSILVVTFLFVSYMFWRILFTHMFSLSKKLTMNIREDIIPDIQKSNTAIITLSSASIVLSFTALKAFSTNVINNQEYLIGSWVGFALSVVFGICASVLVYVYRAHYKTTIKFLYDLEDNKNNSELRETTQDLLDKAPGIQTTLFVLLYLQSVLFTGGVLLFTLFSIFNI